MPIEANILFTCVVLYIIELGLHYCNGYIEAPILALVDLNSQNEKKLK